MKKYEIHYGFSLYYHNGETHQYAMTRIIDENSLENAIFRARHLAYTQCDLYFCSINTTRLSEYDGTLDYSVKPYYV